MPLFEKFQAGNESPNQIVVEEKQEVGSSALLSFSLPFPPLPPLLPPVSKFSKLDKVG